MDKIVRIENRIVSVGKADGSLEEFDIAYFNFPPRIGDYVNIYRNDDSTRAGMLSLIFCWTGIPAIYGIYKFIIALSKPADENGCIEM